MVCINLVVTTEDSDRVPGTKTGGSMEDLS